MKKRARPGALFAVLCLTFGCLLLCSAPRLIASGEAGNPSMPPQPPSVWFQAALSCPPAQQPIGDAQPPREERKLTAAARAADPTQETMPAPVTDANGNILLHCSYVRCVYQAFTLSDGFV